MFVSLGWLETQKGALVAEKNLKVRFLAAKRQGDALHAGKFQFVNRKSFSLCETPKRRF